MKEHSRFELTFFLGLFLGSLVLTFILFRPVLTALGVAAIFAVLLYPLHVRIKRVVRVPTIAALLSTVVAFLLIVIPIGLIASLLFQEARSLGAAMSAGGGWNSMMAYIAPVEAFLDTFMPGMTVDVQALIAETVNWVTRNLGGAFAGTAQFVISFFVGFVAFFYFMKDGPAFLKVLIDFSPLSDTYDRAILAKLQNTVNSVIQGSLAIAVIQGVLTSIGFAIFGVPNPVLWGSMAAIAAVLPAIGPSLVNIPAVIFLYLTGSVGAAIGLLVWGLIVVGLVDNILLPKIMGHRARIHPLLILISILGGLHLFGPAGFLLGPLVLSFVYALGDIYRELFLSHIKEASQEVREEQINTS